jgi:hypothetical protein
MPLRHKMFLLVLWHTFIAEGLGLVASDIHQRPYPGAEGLHGEEARQEVSRSCGQQPTSHGVIGRTGAPPSWVIGRGRSLSSWVIGRAGVPPFLLPRGRARASRRRRSCYGRRRPLLAMAGGDFLLRWQAATTSCAREVTTSCYSRGERGRERARERASEGGRRRLAPACRSAPSPSSDLDLT